MKILARHKNDGLVVGHALNVVSPAARELEGGFDGLGSGIHREHFVVAESRRHCLLHRTQLVVVKSTRSQCQRARLVHERTHDARMAMSLIHCTVRT